MALENPGLPRRDLGPAVLSMPKWRTHAATSTAGTGISAGHPKARRAPSCFIEIFGQGDVTLRLGCWAS